ncbi:MAG: adenylosuccinate synthase [Anaerolineales bacterium]|nr:adenylosuccinate synthase [Anaerolineales bacterium]MCB0013107.1 adenylosuccinate synthase [Anaerolineales bacterium]MCB0020449.1 adenylosuccinate synthase [Anaerolineales bacterium]
MGLDIILGAQWGDEGKGRFTDLLAAEADIVARFSGGDNAGHTVTIGQEIFKLHLIPSGIIHPGVVAVIGNGVVVNPATLLREMEGLAQRGIDVGPARLQISQTAHLITPAHVALDKAEEASRGDDMIGTTLRGIGPAYVDKTGRSGLRAGLLRDPEQLADAILAHVESKNKTLVNLYGAEPLDANAVARQFVDYARQLGPHVVDSTRVMGEALAANKRILAEGAQGTLLDLDHGTYPFVTSSSPTAGGAMTGLGIGPTYVNRVVGVAKAFTSRVGSGPFPTELDGDEALRLRGTGENPWDEYGTTTGRPRRVGWLDLNMLRFAKQVNGLTEIVLTKLDVLSGLAQIPVCVSYELDGATIDYFPSDQDSLARCRPNYVMLPGWQQDITGATSKEALPADARAYIEFIAEKIATPISMVSVGPARAQVIHY